MILHLILTSVLKELWCDKSFFLCLNKKLSLHFLNPQIRNYAPI